MAMASSVIGTFFQIWKENRDDVIKRMREKDFSSFVFPSTVDRDNLVDQCSGNEGVAKAYLHLSDAVSASILINIITMMEQRSSLANSDAILAAIWNEQEMDLNGAREELWERIEAKAQDPRV